MDENKESKYISLLSDTTFKYMFKDERFRPFFVKIIKYITNIDIEGYKLLDNELNTGNMTKDYRLDILLEKGNDLISVEMNQFVGPSVGIKNHTYLYRLAESGYISGEKFIAKRVKQLNFNNERFNLNKDIGIVKYQFLDDKYKTVIKDIEDYEIYLLNYKGIRYNGSNEEEMFLSMFTATSYKELREIVGEHKEALKIVEELEKLGIDDKYNAYYDDEIIRKKEMNSARSDGYDEGYSVGIEQGKREGIEQGTKDNKISIARKLLEDNISIENISTYTDLSIEEINNLINS